MRERRANGDKRSEAGIALLISIFVLLLISVIAIALIVSSGTESALAGNYRSSTGVYYAALSGIEEARGRLRSSNPAAFTTTDPTTFLPATPLIMGDTYYLINPVGGESVTPWVAGSTYEDKQYGVEFGPSGFAAPANPSKWAYSVWNRNPLQSLNLPGPLYKWVRINAVSEKSLGVDADADGYADYTNPLYYDGANFSNNSGAGLPQVLELTAFAVLPNGSQKILQYVVAQTPIALPPLDAALTLSDSSGHSASFSVPDYAHNTVYAIKGDDQDCNGVTPYGTPVDAIGVFLNTDVSSVINAIPSSPASVRQGYTGSAPAADVKDLSGVIPVSFRTPAYLDAIVQNIMQNADAVLTPSSSTSPPYTAFAPGLHAATTAAGMSSTNPVTVVVNGNLDASNWGGGGYGYGPAYGLLVVTGKFTYDPDTNWNGIILVIGQGSVNNTQHGGYNWINGAMFVANTGPHGALLPYLGGASVQFDDPMQGFGIHYSSCWIQRAQPKSGYKVLSFHEITQ